MKLETIIKKKVGSSIRLGVDSNDIDVRVFFLNPEKKINFKSSIDSHDKILDLDYWELEFALNDIINGGDNIFLYNTIISPDFELPNYLGLKLIENRKKLIGKKLIEGAVKYINKKKNIVFDKLPGRKTLNPNKQIYYACSDVKELILNINDSLCYPLKLEQEIIDIKNNLYSLEESLLILDDIQNELLSVKISQEVDNYWVRDFINECYDYYSKTNFL